MNGTRRGGKISMRSLFIKIFLWFWVAMALVSCASFLSAVVTESHPFFAIPWLARLIVRPPTHGHLEINPGSYGPGAVECCGKFAQALRSNGRRDIRA